MKPLVKITKIKNAKKNFHLIQIQILFRKCFKNIGNRIRVITKGFVVFIEPNLRDKSQALAFLINEKGKSLRVMPSCGQV